MRCPLVCLVCCIVVGAFLCAYVRCAALLWEHCYVSTYAVLAPIEEAQRTSKKRKAKKRTAKKANSKKERCTYLLLMWEDCARAHVSQPNIIGNTKLTCYVYSNPSKNPPSILAIFYLVRSLHLTQQN
jgi:hypothetical protein